MKWLKSETGVRCLAAFSFLLIFSMGVLIYETMELVSDFKQHILVDQNDNSIVDKDFDPDLLVQKRINRFVSAFLLLLLGMTIIVLVFSLKQFNKTGLPHIDKKTMFYQFWILLMNLMSLMMILMTDHLIKCLKLFKRLMTWKTIFLMKL